MYKVKSLNYEIKDIDNGVVVFAFNAFDVKDADNDITRKGFWKRSWDHNKDRIKHFLNHDVTQPLGKVEEMWEDNSHAFAKSKVGGHRLGDDYIDMVKGGLITEHSFGFDIVNPTRFDGGRFEIKEAQIWEVSSLTHWGANQFTPIISLSKGNGQNLADNLKKRVERITNYVKGAEASDETIALLLLEIKQLNNLLIEIKSTDSVDETTPPDSTEDELLLKIKLMDLKF